MKKIAIIGFSIFSFLAFSEVKVAYVDLQRALQTVEAGKKAKAQLEKEMAHKKASLEKEQSQLLKEAEEFDKKVAIFNEVTRLKKQNELEKKKFEFQKKALEIQMSLQQKERDLTKPIIDELRAIIEEIGKTRKYQLIIEKNEGAVLYAESGGDLTQEVISRFNSRKKK